MNLRYYFGILAQFRIMAISYFFVRLFSRRRNLFAGMKVHTRSTQFRTITRKHFIPHFFFGSISFSIFHYSLLIVWQKNIDV